jgi:hypothetical protein
VTRFYSIDDANATMAKVEPILVALRDERQELVRLRDRALAGRSSGEVDRETKESERLLRLRMQGLIDQMQAGVMRLDELGVTLREIESGLIDFAALVNGRQVWLCWRLGEGPIEWWHELDTGFASRQRLIDLV